MAIIISYPSAATVTTGDNLLGTQFDGESGANITKNFSVGKIANLVISLMPQGVDSVFGRTGDVVATIGDYTTSLVTEGTNLYYTNTRARAAISLTVAGTSGAATYNNTTGVLNIPQYAAGISWLESNATDLTVWNNGKGNIETNTSFGDIALISNTTGDGNSAIGYRALNANTIGAGNTAIGLNSLRFNTQGNFNTSIGWASMSANVSGIENVALGLQSLKNNTTGNYNVSIGARSLGSLITGSNNVAIGFGSFQANESGVNNTALGRAAGAYAVSSSSNNVYIGHAAGPLAPTTENNKLYISNVAGTPLIGGDFVTRIVTIDQVLVLTPVTTLPSSPVNGMITVQGVGAAQHIYCYINGAWKQLDN